MIISTAQLCIVKYEMYLYIIYTLFLRKMKEGRGKEMDQSLRNARNMEQSGGCSEQACWGGGDVKVTVR